MDSPLPRTPALPDEPASAVVATTPKAYADFLQSFVKAHPMPRLADPEESEIFGPLAFGGLQYFLKYSARAEDWSIVRLLSPSPLSELPRGDIEPSDAAKRNALLALPPPFEPEEGADNLFSDPFLHNGERFAWIYVRGNGGGRMAIFESPEPA